MVKNRVPRKIFGLKRREGVRENWRKLHNELLHDLYYPLNVMQAMKSQRMQDAGHVACVGEKRNAYRASVGNP
jgi:hypothetical protein